MLWTLAGDIRALLMLPAALTMQVAHPAVGAGVDEYSVFRTDPWGRGERSLRSLQLWVYGGEEAAEEGRRLRELHRTIQGTDARGRSYHALDPAYYAWVHATGFPVYQHALRYLARPLTEAQERQLYAEWLQVGRVLGIHDRDMPQTIEEFWPYYRRMLAEELEATVVVRELIATDRRRAAARPAGRRCCGCCCGSLWPVLLPAVRPLPPLHDHRADAARRPRGDRPGVDATSRSARCADSPGRTGRGTRTPRAAAVPPARARGAAGRPDQPVSPPRAMTSAYQRALSLGVRRWVA